jgi:hypothetical protein
MTPTFKGFNPSQKEVLARRMGYGGEMSGFDTYLKENPDQASVFNGYNEKAKKRLEKRVSFAEGGVVNPNYSQTSTTTTSGRRGGTTSTTVTNPQTIAAGVRSSEGFQQTQDMIDNPDNYTPNVTVQEQEVQNNELLDQNSGQVGANPNVTSTNAATPTTAPAPQVEAAKTQADVEIKTAEMEAAQAQLSQQSQTQAQALDPQNLAQLGYSAEQIAEAQKIQAPAARILEAGEAINGSSVDMDKVNEAIDVQAATADPSKKATVQGQLEGLLEQFDGGATPPWAAGAMRLAQQTLIARGLGSSSIAGQAVIQAAMESALPIAQQDASTFAAFEQQNLSNRQQTALFGAEQRAKFLGMKFDQDFQSKVMNAAKISDIANMNFTATQQIALENARLAQTVDLANLDARNAKLLGDMAAMSQADMANLNNRQQAAVLNAQSFLQRDMAQFDADQQTQMFKAQSIIQSLFTDTAAENAARQFNASSESQTTQFFASLQSQVDMFNSAQTTDTEKFNRQMADARDQFNASNRLIIDQSNAQWRRQVSSANTAAINEANMFEAQANLGITTAAYNNWMQTERDLYSFAYDSSEKALDRATQITLARMQGDANKKGAMGQALGSLAGAVVNGIFG